MRCEIPCFQNFSTRGYAVSWVKRVFFPEEKSKLPTLEEQFAEKTKAVRKRVRTTLEYIRDVYGFRVEMGRQSKRDIGYSEELTKLNLTEADAALQVISEELAKYPPSYVHAARIRCFRLAKGMKFKSIDNPKEIEAFGGMAFGSSCRTVYVSSENGDMDYLRERIHHELFHRAEQESEYSPQIIVGGIVTVARSLARDWSWGRLNPGGTKYLRNAYRGIRDHNYQIAGFARLYGKRDEGEDRATVAEALMTAPLETRRRTKEDHVFRKKVAGVMGFFEQRSGGLMGYEWFREVVDNGSFKAWRTDQ